MTIRINRVYTRGGDKGETSLVSGQRVPKDSLRVEAFGTVDELNAVLGIARVANRDAPESDGRQVVDMILGRIQNELFSVGADLATRPRDRHPKQVVIVDADVERLEGLIDQLNEGLPELLSFVLPGGGMVAAFLHQARTVCRRAERIVTTLARQEEVRKENLVYLNRLSDLLFVLSRFAARSAGEPEVLWETPRS